MVPMYSHLCWFVEGVRTHNPLVREVEVYNLDAAIAVGYRVNSIKATHFRIWATSTLREFIVKRFVLNDQMLKNGRAFGKDYFDELLEKIREIRASERRAYQKITDVFQECSSDYQSKAEETQLFYQIVQNQLHFATTGKTAAEIIYGRADSTKPTSHDYERLVKTQLAPLHRASTLPNLVSKTIKSEGKVETLPRF
jgi:hypothetical protein